MANNFYSLTVKELIRETKNTVSIVFDIPSALAVDFKYKAGHYLTLKLIMNGEEVRRSYSISSYGNEPLKVSCKMIPGGKMSTYLFEKLGVGDQVDVMAPMGNFTVKNPSKDVVLFAAGSGITPIISILKQTLATTNQRVQLYYGNRSEEEIIFKAELEQLRAENSDRLMVQHFLSSNGERLDSERVQSIVSGIGDDKKNCDYFICGPEGMIAAVKSGLESSNLLDEQIHIEYFGSPKVEKAAVETVAASGDVNDIVAVIDGEEHAITLEEGESILDGANRIGIDPPFSCQSGVCTTCKCKVQSGEVDMENNFGLGEDEVEEGFILSCISKPKTAGVKVNWDEV